MRFTIQKTLLAAFTAAAVMLAGCSDAVAPVAPADAPMGPALAQTSTELSSSSQLDIIARFNTRPVITIAWAKKWIGPEGGRLEFQGFAVDVPPGAVEKTTQFSIRLPVDPKGAERVVAEFGPHGTKFKQPVVISFPLAGTSIEGAPNPTVVWWNNGWVDMGAWVSGDGRLSTYTDHFSEYGTTTTESFRGGTMTTSGG